MSASPIYRFSFEDGGPPLEVPGNQWLFRPGGEEAGSADPRCCPARWFSAGHHMAPDGLQGPTRVVAGVEIVAPREGPWKAGKPAGAKARKAGKPAPAERVAGMMIPEDDAEVAPPRGVIECDGVIELEIDMADLSGGD
jgi:hypothetical protein